MADGCSLEAQVAALQEEGLSGRQIAKFLGISPTTVARYLGTRWGHAPSAPGAPTTTNPGRHDFAVLGDSSRRVLSALAELGGEAHRIQWLRATGLRSPALQAITQHLTHRYIEATGEPKTKSRTWHLTPEGWAVVRGERERTDQGKLQRVIVEARTRRVSDRAIATHLGVSTRWLRTLAGPRNDDRRRKNGCAGCHQPGCTPCPRCNRPIFVANFRGVCRRCSQRAVPATIALAIAVEVAVPVQVALKCQCAACACRCKVCQVVGHVPPSQQIDSPPTSRSNGVCHTCAQRRPSHLLTRAPATPSKLLCPECWERYWLELERHPPPEPRPKKRERELVAA